MAKRWKAIIDYVYRFKITLPSWAAIHSLFFRNYINIGFYTLLKNKMRFYLNNILALGLKGFLRKKGKVRFNNEFGIGLLAKLKGILKLNVLSGFEVGTKMLLNRKRNLKKSNKIGIDFNAKFFRRRRFLFNKKLEVGFFSFLKRKSRLWFNNRKLTVYTVTMLKNFTIETLKMRTIGIMKREWRIIPQFKIDFYANLRIKKGSI